MLSRYVRLAFVFVLFLLLSSGSSLRAEYRLGNFYVNPVLAHWMEYQNPNCLDDGSLWGARLGMSFCPVFALEYFHLRGLTEISPNDAAGMTKVNANYDAFGGAARLMIPAGRVIPFLTVGLGKAHMKPDRALTDINGMPVRVSTKESRNLTVFGAGLEYFVHPRVSLRFDAIDHYIKKDFIPGDLRGERRTHNWELGAGVSFLFGRTGEKKVKASPPPAPAETRPAPPPAPPKEEKPAPAPAPRVEEPAKPKVQPDQFRVDVYFDFDRALVKSEYFARLDKLAALLKETGETVNLIGYTDQAGASAYNVRLSERRAQAVRDYLTTAGVKPSQISIAGKGKFPVPPAPPADSQRRVEIHLLER